MITLRRTIHCCVARCSSKYSRQKKRKALEELLMVMPKDSKLTAELQKHRHKLKEKTMKYSAGSVTLQVLGSGAKGAPRALYVFTDQSRYLFNCGEGTQRLAHEHKMKLSKLEHIFITHPSWRNIGGLPGVSLTIQDVGVPEITIHGPKGTADIYMATRRFVVLKDLAVKFRTDASSQFSDSVMNVDYIPISPVGKEHVSQTSNPEPVNIVSDDDEDDNEDYYSYESRKASDSNSQSKRKKTSETNERKRLKLNGSLHRLGEVGACSMCYICRLHPKQGALQLDKCVEKGVPPGPLLGQLKAGRDVSLPNGVVVKASDVCSPPDPGPIFLVIECPSVDYIDSLLKNENICKYSDLSNSEERDNLMAIAHFSPPDVISHPKYIEWVSNLPASVTHLSFGEESNCTGSVAVHRLQYKLNLLHPKIFPLLADCGIPYVPNNKNSTTKDSNSRVMQPIKDATNESSDASQHVRDQFLHNCFIKARTFYNIHLRPRKGFDSSTSLQMDHQEFIDETLGVDGFLESMKSLKEKLECIKPSEPSYPKVLFLGTGSCIPNKTRNTSGILIEISDQSCMLLDCGEGTYGQLVRFFGQDESNAILSRLNCVFVSHLHADHHIGLISLLKERQKILKESNTLYLLAPRQIMFWLSFYHDGFESILNGVKLIPCAEVVSKHVDPNAAEHPVTSFAMRNLLGLQEVATAPVCHCPNAFGVAITHKEGWKITYSGDTMPCNELVKLGMESDLLIHEATMEDELIDEARAKRHSTTSEAVKIGHEMQARFTILTHFSQRYAKLPRIQGSMKANVGIAFDNMQVTLQDLKVLPIMYPALKLMFSEHCEEMEHKATKRQHKLERERKNVP